CSPEALASSSIRSARSRISGEYFWFIVFHPCFKNGTKPRPIQSALIVEDAGHFVQMERPDVVNHAMVEFLDSLPGR
ncbi:alpha/beta fold hydrolase, partial [Mycobacteroides abscessus]|uniref:alpha/beta fold hydrolase n=1 Tax=Mycobacteroides abscessus TaxID=36809 RepID=UPI002106BF4D